MITEHFKEVNSIGFHSLIGLTDSLNLNSFGTDKILLKQLLKQNQQTISPDFKHFTSIYIYISYIFYIMLQ